MRIGVLGTGAVGRALGGAFVAAGHEVRLGSRRADHPDAVAWAEGRGDAAGHGTFATAAGFGEVVVNATAGAASLDALATVAPGDLDGKVLLDVANPLDFSQGFPPTLTVANTDSLAERIQRSYPAARVVKSLNTMANEVMVAPQRLAGDHVVFVAGDDADAKATVGGLLADLGWGEDAIVDLGGLEAARGTEMYLALWVRLLPVVGERIFNLGIVRDAPQP